MGGGKGGEQGNIRGSKSLSDMLVASLFSKGLERDPNMARFFAPGTQLHKKYRQMTGSDELIPYKAPERPPAMGQTTLAAANYLNPGASAGFGGFGGVGSSSLFPKTNIKYAQGAGSMSAIPTGSANMMDHHIALRDHVNSEAEGLESHGGRGHYKGAGALSPVPTGLPNPAKMTTPSFGASPNIPLSVPQLAPIKPLSIPQQKYDLMSNMGAEQIGRQARMGTQDIFRNANARGLAQSGLPFKAATDALNRGTLESMANFQRGLQTDRMGLEFGEAQKARDLGFQRDVQQGQFGLQGRQQAFNEATGLGQLGLAERAQGLAEIGGSQKYSDYLLPILGGLGQSVIAGQVGQPKGKK